MREKYITFVVKQIKRMYSKHKPKPLDNKWTLPTLVKSRNKPDIIVMVEQVDHEEFTGMCLVSDDKHTPIGRIRSNWKKAQFEPLNEGDEIILTQ